MLVHQPGGRPGCRPQLGGGDLSRLQRRGDDHQPAALLGEQGPGGGEGGGLAGAGRALDHDQAPRSVARQGRDRRGLSRVQPIGVGDQPGRRGRLRTVRGQAVGRPGQVGVRQINARSNGAVGEPGGQLSLDVEHLAAGQRPDVLGHAVPVQQRNTAGQGAGGEVFGELDPHSGIGDDPGGGDQLLDFAADVGGVPG